VSQLAADNATRANVGDDVAALCRQAKRLCRRVAGPDLADAPIYIVCQSAIADRFGRAEGCEAYTTPSLDLYLADHIPGYRGRGPCIVVNDLTLAEDRTNDPAYWFTASALHELAHILDRPALFEDRTGENPNKIKFEALCLRGLTAEPDSVGGPRYRGHEASFVRTVLHLCHRAARCGRRIAPSAVFNCRSYGLSRPERYAKALADEPRRCAGILFRDILANDPPAAFTRIWHDDVRHRQSMSPAGEAI
jgi:hypothetical protein